MRLHAIKDRRPRTSFRNVKVSVKKGLWAGVFVLVFLFSQAHWFLLDGGAGPGPWNLPLSVYYFLFLQLLLAVLLGVFLGRRSSRNDSDRGH